MKTRILVLMAFVFTLAAVSGASSLDKKSVFNNLINKYGNLRSVEFDFFAADGSDIKGKIKAKRGNKYVLEMNDRTIVSNGSKIWNYSKADNNVIISQYSDLEGSASLENFFFEFLNNYKAVKLEEYAATNNLDKGYKLTLHPRKENAAIDNVREIILYLDETQDLGAISLETANSYQYWEVRSIKTNPSMQESVFKFKIPENAEVINIE